MVGHRYASTKSGADGTVLQHLPVPMPAATWELVKASESDPATEPTESLPLAATRVQSSIEAGTLPAAADARRSGQRQRAPFVLGVVVVVAFVAVSVSYVRLVGAADRRSDDRAPHLAVPSSGPSHHDVAGPVAPSADSTHGTDQSPGPPNGVVPSGTPDASAPPADVVETPTQAPTDRPGSPAVPDPAELTATASTAKRRLPPGYVGQVIVSNVGGTTAVGWTVSMSVGTHAQVSSVAGARVQQVGSVVTFVPEEGARRIPSGGSVRFAFRVLGLFVGRPTDCVVNGIPCQ
jgi:hypothetical protein